MSDLRKTPVAITTSDWHIRGTPPASRAESDWFAVMEARLTQLADLQKRLQVPILVCGDLFDRPNPTAHIVKWFLDIADKLELYLYVIPGQHDLAGHSLDYISSSAYGIATSKPGINHLKTGEWQLVPVGREHGVFFYAMPWGHYEMPPELLPGYRHLPKVAAVHKYIYCSKETAYVGAEEEGNVIGHTAWGRHFDVIAIGDNHISWRAGKFINHGSLFSLTSAQKDHEHLLGIVYSDGSLETMVLPETRSWKEVYVPPTADSKAGALLAELAEAELDTVAFDVLLDRLEEKLSDGAKRELRELRADNG